MAWMSARVVVWSGLAWVAGTASAFSPVVPLAQTGTKVARAPSVATRPLTVVAALPWDDDDDDEYDRNGYPDSGYGRGGRDPVTGRPRGRSSEYEEERETRAPRGLNLDRSKLVPKDQQPFNELINLKDAPLFGWAQKDLVGLLKRLAVVYGITACISFPIARVTFYHKDELLQSVLAANVGCLAVLAVLMLRLYLGWQYIATRLDSEVVEYEESGWYDGAEWFKPPDVRARDEYLNIYEVQPVLQRTRTALGGIGGLFLATVIAFNIVAPGDPYEIYSTKYTSQLITDDVKAKEAQERADPDRPTYCNSRFYRALAGGRNCD